MKIILRHNLSPFTYIEEVRGGMKVEKKKTAHKNLFEEYKIPKPGRY